MTALNRNKTTARLALYTFTAIAILGLGACAIQEGTDPNNSDGLVVAVSDTSSINLTFDNLAMQTYSDSGEFNLDDVRARLKDKGINPDSVTITGLKVTYDATTAEFLAANSGVRYYLKIFTRDGIAGQKLLTLETGKDSVGTLKALSFDPKMVLFELYKQIFPAEAGYPGVKAAIKDVNKHSLKVIAELTLLETLKTKGMLKLNLVVTVAGKV